MSEVTIHQVRASSRMIRCRDSVAAVPDFLSNRGFSIRRPDGTTDLLVRTGADGALTIVRSDPDSDTGWSFETTNQSFELAPSGKSNQLGTEGYAYVGVADSETTWLFAVGISQAGLPEIRFTSKSGGGGWPAQWSTCPIVTDKGTDPEKIELQVALVNGQPALLAWIFWNRTGPSDYGLWQVPWQEPGNPWKALPFGFDQNAWVETPKGPALLGLVTWKDDSSPDPPPVGLYLYRYPFGDGDFELTNGMTSAAAIDASLYVAPTPDGSSRAFLYIPYTDEAGIYEIDLAAIEPPRKMATTDTPERIYADASHGQVDIFYTDPKSRLLVMHEESSGQLSPPVFLGVEATHPLLAHMTKEQTDLFFWNRDRLTRMSWNPTGGSSEQDPGFWRFEDVELPGSKPDDRAYYVTRLTLLDADGEIIPNRSVSLFAGQDTRVLADSVFTVLADDLGTAMTADASGGLNLYSPTGTIDVGELFVDGGGGKMPPVRRNGKEIDALSKVTSSQMKAILPASQAKNAEPLAEAARSAIGAAVSAAPAAAGERARVGVPESGDGSWSFNYRDGSATYNRLTADEARSRLATAAARESEELPEGYGSLWSYLGDLLEEAEHEIETAFELVVDVTSDGIHFALTVVTAAGTYVYNGIHGFIDEAVAFAETMMRLFTSGERVLELVIFGPEGYSEGIWKAKGFLEGQILAQLPQFSSYMGRLADKVQSGGVFDPKSYASSLQALQQHVGSQKFGRSPASRAADATKGPSLASLAEENAAVLQFVLKYVGDKGLSASLPATWRDEPWIESLTSSFHSANNAIGQIASGKELDQALKALRKHLASIDFASSIESFRGEELSTLLGYTESLGESLLESFQGVAPDLFTFVDDGLAALEKLVATEIEANGALQDLYDWLNPGESEPVTVQGLAALSCAVPIELFSQIVSGRSWIEDPEAETSTEDLALGVFIVQIIWTVLAGLISAVGILKVTGVDYLLWPAVLVPIVGLILSQIILIRDWDDLPKALRGLYETEWSLALVPYLMVAVFGILAWLAIAVAGIVTEGEGLVEVVPIVLALAGTVGSFLLMLISIPQIAIAGAAIGVEAEKDEGANWKNAAHLATPIANFFQFGVGMTVPLGAAAISVAANTATAWAIEKGRHDEDNDE